MRPVKRLRRRIKLALKDAGWSRRARRDVAPETVAGHPRLRCTHTVIPDTSIYVSPLNDAGRAEIQSAR